MPLAKFGIIFPAEHRTVDIDFLKLGEIPIIEVRHDQSNRVTEFPVESGATITDHVQALPVRISIRGMVGDLFLQRGFKKADIATAWEQLRTFMETAELLDFVTDVRSYENMVITSISAPRNAAVGRAMTFTMDMQEIRLVEATQRMFVDGGVDDVLNPVLDRPADDDNTGGIGITPADDTELPDKTGLGGPIKGGGGLGGHAFILPPIDEEVPQSA